MNRGHNGFEGDAIFLSYKYFHWNATLVLHLPY